MIRYDNLRELLEKRQPVVHEIGHPKEFGKQVPGEVRFPGYIPPPIEIHEGDILIADNAAAGGLGDPIERDPAWVKADLDNGLATAEMARNIYCVQVSFDEQAKEWKVNEAATRNLREVKRKERLARGIPMKQWWEKSRRRLMARELDDKLVEMYQSSMKMSQAFAQEFRDFWALPDDFAL